MTGPDTGDTGPEMGENGPETGGIEPETGGIEPETGGTGPGNDLERHVRWLYGHIRATAGDRVARFDRDPEIDELAAAAERCREVSEPLLDRATRDRYDADVTAWQSWREKREICSSAAIRVGPGIAETPPGSDARQAHQREYEAARAQLKVLDGDRERLERAADEAESALREDASRRAEHAEVIERGGQAWTELTARLRAEVRSAVDAFEVLPKWFEHALGMSPAADADHWYQVGAEVLAYRATYGIEDDCCALGPPPLDESPEHRVRWHRQLVACLEEHGTAGCPDGATG